MEGVPSRWFANHHAMAKPTGEITQNGHRNRTRPKPSTRSHTATPAKHTAHTRKPANPPQITTNKLPREAKLGSFGPPCSSLG